MLALASGAVVAAVAVTAFAGWRAVRWASRHPLSRRILALPTRGKLALVRRLLRSEEVPLVARLALPALLLYLLMPFDVIPDVIPVLGHADDMLAVAAAIALVLWLTPATVIERALEAEEAKFVERG